jgi:hypothetical protein
MIFSIIIWINVILDQANLAVTVIGWVQFGLLTFFIGLPISLLIIVMVVPVKYELRGVLCEAKEFSDEENEMEEKPSGIADMIKKIIVDSLYKITDPIIGTGKFSWLSGFIKGDMYYKDRELTWKMKVFIKEFSSEDVSAQEGDEDNEENNIEEEEKESKEAGSKKEKLKIENKEDMVIKRGLGKPTKAKKEHVISKKKSNVNEENNELEKESRVSLENRQEVKISKSQEIQGGVPTKKTLRESIGEEVRKREVNSKEEKGRNKEEHNNEGKYNKEDISKDEDDNIIDKEGSFFEQIAEGYENTNEKMENTY